MDLLLSPRPSVDIHLSLRPLGPISPSLSTPDDAPSPDLETSLRPDRRPSRRPSRCPPAAFPSRPPLFPCPPPPRLDARARLLRSGSSGVAAVPAAARRQTPSRTTYPSRQAHISPSKAAPGPNCCPGKNQTITARRRRKRKG